MKRVFTAPLLGGGYEQLENSVPSKQPTMFYSVLESSGHNKKSRGWRMDINNSQREPFEISWSELELMVSSSLCQDQVRESYVKKQLEMNSVFMFLFYELTEEVRRRQKTTRVPAAFMMGRAHEDNKKEFYIDVICSGARKEPYFIRHTGAMLLQAAIQYAKENGYEQVSLSALPHVLTYYPRLGFAHRPSCDQPSDVQIPERLHEKARNKTLPKTMRDAYDDDDLLDYMSELQFKKYGNYYKADCDTAGKTKVVIKKNLKDNRCGDDGFKMRLCFNEKL